MSWPPHEDLAIDVVVAPRDLWRFFTLVRSGFQVRTEVPCRLQDLLCDRLKIPAEYVSERVQTVFLNGRAVDDIPAAAVADGAVVTLSAAMPGLVGATLRKGGRLTSLRSSLSYRPSPPPSTLTLVGEVTVKLFNLICADLAPAFLARGLLLPSGRIQEFLADRWADLTPGCLAVRLEGRPLNPPTLPSRLAPDRQVRLTVRTQPDSLADHRMGK